ncbi:MAG: DsrE family protein [Arthrobacter sp.]|nr:DsrE family protein [Arthrobacter sp.]
MPINKTPLEAGNDRGGRDFTEAVKSARQLDVSVLACGNSLRSAGLEEKDLSPGIGVVPAAIAHIAQRQWNGRAYARLGSHSVFPTLAPCRRGSGKRGFCVIAGGAGKVTRFRRLLY